MPISSVLLPSNVEPSALPLLISRALRGFADGFVAVLLPAYLLALGFGQFGVGLFSTVTLAGSALASLLVGGFGHRWPVRRLLTGAALLMAGTGFALAQLASFWPLLIVAFVGTLNPSSGDVSVFLPLEQARLARCAHPDSRTALFARYALAGTLSAALGALAAALPALCAQRFGMPLLDAMRAMFVGYGLIGLIIWAMYRRVDAAPEPAPAAAAPLGQSRAIIAKLAALFSVDSFASGLVVNSLLTLWLFRRFDFSVAQAGTFFFAAGLLSAFSQLLAPLVARRIGLLNTMVFTHLPANLCIMLAALAPSVESALALLLARSALSQMDVAPRTAFVMAVVAPAERAAAASFTAVPKSLAAALAPSVSGALIAVGWMNAPLLLCGALKVIYDLSLWAAFRPVAPRVE